MRITCGVAGYDDAWVELDPRFTRRDVTAILDAEEDALLEQIRRRVTACHIPLNDGTAIESADDLTGARLEEADLVVIGWLGGLLPTVIGTRRNLGNASVRLSSGSSGNEIAATKTMPNQATESAA
jgi:hypothetical protein